MRKYCRTLLVAGVAAVAAAFTGVALHAGEDDDEDAAAAKAATEALTKSIERGKELFHSNQLGKKACASCHENPDKPHWSLVTREYSYPKYSRKKRGVVSMGQKINEMLVKAQGKEMDLNGADIVAIEAYVRSLKKQ